MVVSQSSVANDTALTYNKQPIIDPVPLKLDYNLADNEEIIKYEDENIELLTEVITENPDKNASEEQKVLQILDETEIIDDTDNLEIYKEKTVSIPLTQGIETGLEIQFTSLKLKEFPIVESNLIPHIEPDEVVNLTNTNITIGDFTLYNAGIKICSYPNFKIIELKTREFKIGISVGLYDGDTLKSEGEYFYYEIFSHLKNTRLLSVAGIFKKIFSGELISFEINNLKGNIVFENRLQYHKFTIIENAVGIYQKVSKKLRLHKNKNLSEAPLSFYTLYLLDQYISGHLYIDSWINFGIDNSYDINAGDFIVFSKIHTLDMKGINFDLKETIKLKEPITELELSHVKDRVTCYKKIVTIELEKIDKK